jgi:hypothetical protein
MGNETATGNRVEALREDLRVDVKKLTPAKGDVLIVSPRNPRYILSEQYVEFLHDGLKKVANGASVIIATDQLSKLNNIKPPSNEQIDMHYDSPIQKVVFMEGWHAAMETVTKVLNNVG